MFLQFPDFSAPTVHHAALIVITAGIIISIIAVEFGIAELPPEKRKSLRYLQPFMAIFVLLFLFAAFRQGMGV